MAILAGKAASGIKTRLGDRTVDPSDDAATEQVSVRSVKSRLNTGGRRVLAAASKLFFLLN